MDAKAQSPTWGTYTGREAVDLGSDQGDPQPAFIEAIVLSAVTSENKTSGEVRKVTFMLPNDGGDHPFRGLIGQRIGLVCVKLGEAEHEPPVKAPEPEKERHRFNEMPLAQQCALTCDKPAFAAFLATRGCLWRVETRQAEIEEWVRHYCGVESRRELNTDSHAADRWSKLNEDFLAWQRGALK
jgi:hypothetical protein